VPPCRCSQTETKLSTTRGGLVPLCKHAGKRYETACDDEIEIEIESATQSLHVPAAKGTAAKGKKAAASEGYT